LVWVVTKENPMRPAHTIAVHALVALSSLALVSSLAGCAAEPVDDEVSEDDAALTGDQHRARWTACATAPSGSREERDATANRERACIEKANAAAIKQIEANLAAVASPLAGKAKSTFALYRTKTAALCPFVSQASESLTGSLITEASCRRDGEALLATLLDAYVDLGGTQTSIDDAEARRLNANCYVFRDSQIAKGADKDKSWSDFVVCVQQDAKDQAQIMGHIISPPGHDPNRIEEKVMTRTTDVLGAHRDVCAVLSDSGKSVPNRKEAGHRRDACAGNASHALNRLLHNAFSRGAGQLGEL
jgi:hypothetical protein